ncbi:aminotransferase class I/II-fold pyridoxal phosphate-dependent enzyme [Methylobacterium sp. J-078]|uniref:aminotransferase class I/II-fold pyridoxal phosphate-dependent enzyme n=1 Tax=Methylobacterium sp. J-078 TaxID=2836657 RepID=UPI001FBA288A|nr:aminotransferase class I/II-fold pyridoxal phosphate-dependent enzyme [Methylobacterium sp. J-078]MCJ2045499.1 aminotransferase class I/II-fold pyridoxal phosphate-dependent enzyme [Methylobacterium sp. J-078]
MTTIADRSTAELADLCAQAQAAYDAFKARGLKLDMTRGKPAPEQLDLATGMLALPGNGDYTTAAGEDARNYGGQQGLPELRALFSHLIDAPADQIVVGGNSSLALMHDTIVWALLKGVPGSERPWSKEEEPVFLCPVPGYDRHFALCEEFGIRMIPVPMTGQGPDMDVVEAFVANPAVKGMWCVPKYANPSGEIFSDETVRRLAAMKTGAPDFRLFWDNAYAVHHLTPDRHPVRDILAACAEAGHPDRPFLYASTSKITLAGAGLAVFAGSPENTRWFLARAAKQTIGPDKLNQLRHVRFLRDGAGLQAHMDAHRALIAPKFAAVQEALERHLAGTGAARWTRPEGGYFITVEARAGTATEVVRLAKEAGIALTPAGATSPYGRDPQDSVLRLAPTFPSLGDVTKAAEGIALCILLASLEAEQGVRARNAA